MRVVLLASGGLDSTVYGRYLQRDGYEVTGLFVMYGQPAMTMEYLAAERHFPATHVTSIPPITPVGDVYPGRNLALISAGVMFALRHGAEAIAIAPNRSDAEHFPDCGIPFLSCLEDAVDAAYGVSLFWETATWSRKRVVAEAADLGVSPSDCWSCYTAGPEPCGECLSCRQ